MLCDRCQKNLPTVHVTDVQDWGGPDAEGNVLEERHLCEPCAQGEGLPFVPGPSKVAKNLWGLINIKAKQAAAKARTPQISCPVCGTSLEEFRRRGRVGCPECYDAFRPQLQEVLERMHGATRHTGRVPGADPEELERRRRMDQLREDLQRAIDEESYERAASLRDELRDLEVE